MNKEMRADLDRVMDAMVDYEDSWKRIHHFLKVREFAARIGRAENLPEHRQYILEMASLTHDIGIKPALENYGSSAGKYQEFEGPGQAGEMLADLGIADDVIDRVCWLIGHHHTTTDVEEIDHRILLEADALVNAGESEWSREACENYLENVFETDEGKRLFRKLFLSET